MSFRLLLFQNLITIYRKKNKWELRINSGSITQNLVAACTNSLDQIQVKIGRKKLQPSCANSSDCPMLNMNWQLVEVNAELSHHHFCPMMAVSSILGINFCLRAHRTELILCWRRSQTILLICPSIGCRQSG